MTDGGRRTVGCRTFEGHLRLSQPSRYRRNPGLRLGLAGRAPRTLRGIYSAVTRRTLDGKNPAGWIPEQKITVEEAVRAYTSGGATAEFAERDKGTLEAGKLADVVVLSDDIFRISPEKIWDTKVIFTFTGGRQTWAVK